NPNCRFDIGRMMKGEAAGPPWTPAMIERPRLLVTMGDVAGIGPEVIARAWPELNEVCRPVVVGDPHWMRQALRLARSTSHVAEVRGPEEVEPSRSEERRVGEECRS